MCGQVTYPQEHEEDDGGFDNSLKTYHLFFFLVKGTGYQIFPVFWRPCGCTILYVVLCKYMDVANLPKTYIRGSFESFTKLPVPIWGNLTINTSFTFRADHGPTSTVTETLMWANLVETFLPNHHPIILCALIFMRVRQVDSNIFFFYIRFSLSIINRKQMYRICCSRN